MTDTFPAPHMALKSRGWLAVTDTATYPDCGEVTLVDGMVYPFCVPMAIAEAWATLKLEPL